MTAPASPALSAQRPFPGLRPFAFTDHAFFFGRRKQTSALFRLLDRSRFIAVIGSSGSGKSSIVRAGLLPLLEDESNDSGGRSWLWTEMRPGDAPLDNLAEAIVALNIGDSSEEGAALRAARRERIAFALSRSSFGVSEALAEAGIPPGRSVLLLVDQFEELFRYSGADTEWGRDAASALRRRDEAAHFVQLLLEIGRDQTSGVHILITMRSDFIGDCARFYGLPETVSASQFLVPGLTRDQREEVIRKPIEIAGATIDAPLVERLLNDIGDELDQLPVLQHALLRLWEEAGRALPASGADAPGLRHLNIDHYKAIGGLAGALSRHADEVMASLPGLEIVVEQVFRALSEIDREGRPIRRAIPVGQLEAETGVERTDLLRVLDRFRAQDCSFLVPSLSALPVLQPETRIDVGHEALLRRWEQISGKPRSADDGSAQRSGWLAAEETDGRQYRALLSLLDTAEAPDTVTLPLDQIEARQRWWKARQRTAAWAERYGGRIATVERLLDSSMTALEAERENRRREAESERRRAAAAARGNRRARAATAIVIVLIVAAIGFGYYARQQAAVARQEQALAEQEQAIADQQAAVAQQRAALAEEAERNFALGLSATSQLVDQVKTDMTTGAVSVAAAKDLLMAAKTTLTKLASSSAQSEDVVNAQVQLWLTFAQALLASGEADQALEQARQADQVAAKAAAQYPDGIQERTNLAAGHEAMGDILKSRQDVAGLKGQQQAGALSEYRSAISVVQALVTSDPTDLAAQSKLATLSSEAGDILRQQGKLDDALAFYSQAVDIRQKLSSSDPNSSEQMAQLQTSVGNVLQAEGRLADALTAYRTGLATARGLAEKAPANAQLQIDISNIEYNVGDVLKAQGDLVGALTSYREALGIDRALAAKDPSNATWQLDVRADQQRVGGILQAQDDDSGALASYKEALGIAQMLSAKDPGNSELQHDVAYDQTNVGDELEAQNDFTGALIAYQEASKIAEALVAQDSSNSDWQASLSVYQQRIGDVLHAQSKPSGALAAYRRALGIAQSLLAKDPTNSDLQRDVGIDQRSIGDVLKAQNDLPGALAAYQEALNIGSALVARDSTNTDWQIDLGVYQQSIGDVFKAQNDLPDALAVYKEALRIGETLVAKDSSNAHWKAILSADQQRVGDLLKAQNDVAGALTAYEEALSIDRALAAKDPVRVGDVRSDQRRIGDALRVQGDLPGALAAYKEALSIGQALAAKDPQNLNQRVYVGDDQTNIGDVLTAQGDLVSALAAYEGALSIDQALVAADSDTATWWEDNRVDQRRIGGLLAQQKDFEGALTSYRAALTIAQRLATKESGNADRQIDVGSDQANIGDVLLALGRSAEARASFDAALVAAPDDDWAHIGRARAEFFAGQSAAAADDAAAAVKLGATQPNYPYYVLWLHIVRRRAGADDREEFAANTAKLDQAKWPWPIVAGYLGQSNPDTVLVDARTSEDPVTLKSQVCEADFYLGEERLWNNDREEARQLLQSAVDDCPPDFAEYAAAKLELAP